MYTQYFQTTPFADINAFRGDYQQHIYCIPHAEGASMRMPKLVWDYYESECQAVCVCALSRPEPVNKIHPLPLTSPFPADRDIFVVFRSKVPRIHYGWYVS